MVVFGKEEVDTRTGVNIPAQALEEEEDIKAGLNATASLLGMVTVSVIGKSKGA